MSMPGASDPNSRPSLEIWSRSAISAWAAPGYCTFTATSRPSDQTARCTWPIDAEAAGTSSNERNRRRHWRPSPLASTLCTVVAGIGGAASCSLVSVARYGPARSSGNAASKIDMAWPNFIAPPLSSPSTRNSCSAVRAWISAATASAGRPPTRLPNPSAVRPAKPSGSAASFAVRVTARRGRSVTTSLSLPPTDPPTA